MSLPLSPFLSISFSLPLSIAPYYFHSPPSLFSPPLLRGPLFVLPSFCLPSPQLHNAVSSPIIYLPPEVGFFGVPGRLNVASDYATNQKKKKKNKKSIKPIHEPLNCGGLFSWNAVRASLKSFVSFKGKRWVADRAAWPL